MRASSRQCEEQWILAQVSLQENSKSAQAQPLVQDTAPELNWLSLNELSHSLC